MKKHKQSTTIHRFFLIPFDHKGGEFVLRDAEQLHQIVNVLRMRAGDQCEILDNTGAIFTVRLDLVARKEVRGTVLSVREEEIMTQKVYLCFGVLKGARNEYILEKATELGVTDIQPILFERTQPFAWNANKVRRFEAIIKEATEQSEGVVLPLLHEPRTLQELLESSTLPTQRIVFWERTERGAELLMSEGDVAVFIGPEGGITEREIEMLTDTGAIVSSLGKRILRAETAVVAALARTIL